MDATDLGRCLRLWRDRLPPGEAGVVPTRRRRVPGLRRQEVATSAGLSVEYLARLEQGRAGRPSPEVLGPLARTLRLSAEERDHLHRLAGHAPTPGSANRHPSAGLQRIVDRLADAAVVILDVQWDVVLANPLAVALLGPEATRPGAEGNHVRRQFAGRPTRVEHTHEEDEDFEAKAVADLREALGRFPADTGLRSLVSDLRSSSERFAALWASGDVASNVAHRKTIRHPDVGELRVDCDVIVDAASDLRVVVYTAAPGTPAAQSLALLAAIGTQTLARR